MSTLELHDLDFVLVPQKINISEETQFEEFDVLFENRVICKTIELGDGWILVDSKTGSSQKFSLQEELENKILEIANTPNKGNKSCSTPLLS